MGHNPKGMSQTIQLPYANQCPYLEQERNILSVEITPIIRNTVNYIK
jgi:hypothetical protein